MPVVVESFEDGLKNRSLKYVVRFCADNHVFDDSFREIIDSYDIDNFEDVMDFEYYRDNWYKCNFSALKYVEEKFRSSLSDEAAFITIPPDTSIFSLEYLQDLKIVRRLLKEGTITINSEEYKQVLTVFIVHLKKSKIITHIPDFVCFKEIEKLFYRIVMGASLTTIFEIKSVEEIALINRLGNLEFSVYGFTVEQIQRYNVKLHKELCKPFEKHTLYLLYKNLILKLMLLVGYRNAKMILDKDDSIDTLEHLVGDVPVDDVIIDKEGNPILNSKIMYLIFNDNGEKIDAMLKDKESDLYIYFPLIFSKWWAISRDRKDKSLKSVIEYLKNTEVIVSPKYYRLDELFGFIGRTDNVVKDALFCHDQMISRTDSTIPRVKGQVGDYTFEVLRYDDMEALTLGNRTNCCFALSSNGSSCLKQGILSLNGRILVVRKNNELVAHSWIWRNGNVLCIDNIETAESIKQVEFLDVYLAFADEVLKESFLNERNNSIKNVTLGFTDFDKPITGILDYPCYISRFCDLKVKDYGSRLGNNRIFLDALPAPLETVSYIDSTNAQYLIKGTGEFHLGQSSYTYQDERKDIIHYSSDEYHDEEYTNLVSKKINGLRFMKCEEAGEAESFSLSRMSDFKEVYCNDDWYILVYEDGHIEEFSLLFDERAMEEVKEVKSSLFGKTI